MSKKHPRSTASASEPGDQDDKSNIAGKTPEASPAELTARWERINQHHQAAGQAFAHTVICGLEVVRLKLAIRHGNFSEQAQVYLPGIAARTIRRYRQIGEWYLSGAHGRVVTVTSLRADDTEPQEHLCSDEAVTSYLEDNKIRNADDLQKCAVEKAPDLLQPSTTSKVTRVENLLKKVKRAWSRMSPEQKTEFGRRFDELRTKVPKEKPCPFSADTSATSEEEELHSDADINASDTAVNDTP